MILDEKDNDLLYSKPDPEELVLEHYGTKYHSGRYPYGSGEEPYQHAGDFRSRVAELKKEGKNENEIAEYFGLSLKDYKKEYSVATNYDKLDQYKKIKVLSDKGYSNRRICRELGWPESKESTVRSILNPSRLAAIEKVQNTSNFLKDQVKDKKYIDISFGTEKDIGETGISRDRLDTAIYDLKMQGYNVYKKYINQPTNIKQQTTFTCLCAPDVSYSQFMEDMKDTSKIGYLRDFKSDDGGETFHPKFQYPKSLDSKRLMIRYADDVGPDGARGIDKDGLIEIRRGVPDLNLGNDHFAQVRILVDNNKYLKGMCVYSDNMPDGVDVVFNTNKTSDKPMSKVLKDIETLNESDENGNPFGTTIRAQSGVINKVRGEGEWGEWSKNLPSQFLSKQSLELAKTQLNKKYETDLAEFDDICKLENPTVKKKLLKEFSDNCDSASVHLKAAALPGQQYHVMVPINTLKDNEIYAPGYENGTKLALIRYPHGGIFEIPELTVNNKNKLGQEIITPTGIDGVGVNSKVAAQLSGADFDGDTVMVIPNSDKVGIIHKPYLDELKNFDPKIQYATHYDEKTKKYYDDTGREINIMQDKDKGKHMGIISNLITDMTIAGADYDDIAKAVKHSMVVIDAPKHKLDWQRSEIDNDISRLKKLYQVKWDENKQDWHYGGASTIISRAKSTVRIPRTQGQPRINAKFKNGKPNPDYDPNIPEGEYIYKTSDKAYFPKSIKRSKNDDPNIMGYELLDGGNVKFDRNNDKDREYYMPNKKPVKDEQTGEPLYYTTTAGELKYKVGIDTQEKDLMSVTKDAYDLVSAKRSPMELAYADYANKMKALANEARKQMMYTKDIDRDPEAAKQYSNEVNSLMSKLNEAYKNKTPERAATALANSRIKAQITDDMSTDKKKKIAQIEMERARNETGSRRKIINITPEEWKAIQAGAISKTKLSEILNYADIDVVREMAMPKTKKVLTTSQISKAKQLMNTKKYTLQQIADSIGASSVTSMLKQLEKSEKGE